MKKITSIILTAGLFLTAFVTGQTPENPITSVRVSDTLSSVWLYTEGIKRLQIKQDSANAIRLFREAIQRDSTYAPAYYQIVSNNLHKDLQEGVELARKAWQLDSTNVWYHRYYGQSLILAGEYGEAVDVFRDLCKRTAEPDNYRLLAALYQQVNNPYMALSVLDSAEIRFGRIPLLSIMKRRLLVGTHQLDKAIDEAKALVSSTPFEVTPHVDLGDLYSMSGKDSLAKIEYETALKIDSTNVSAMMALSDYYNSKDDYLSALAFTKRIFESENYPLKDKVKRFERLTSSIEFYQRFYPQINELAATLMIHYPQEQTVVELYATHLIKTGQLDEALNLYKLHLNDTPPVKEYFFTVIDIETFKQRPDSIALYVNRALKVFPEEARLHMTKGNSFNYAKQYPEALEAYKSSLIHAQNDSVRSVIWGAIGDTYHNMAEDNQPKGKLLKKWKKKSYAAYEKGLKFDGENISILNNYAYFLSLEGGDLNHALVMAEKVIRLEENNPTYMDTYAWILYKMERYQEAKKVMQQALALDGRNNAELLIHYGDILAAMGQDFLAESYWRRALEKGYDAEVVAQKILNLKNKK